jgi:phosphoserine aminotransferase
MSQRIFNFSAGPACLPESVLEEAQANLLSLGSTGIGILEHSHRGKAYLAVHEEAVSLIRELGQVPDSHDVLFLTGGASLQFSMIPLNLLPAGETADYLVTGMWSQKAVAEARRVAQVHEACSSADRNFCYIPPRCQYSPRPRYVHFTSNNTIFGTQFHHTPTPPAGVPLVCDASSDIFSRPIDVSQYGLIYAGAQKNLGPSGVTVVIIRKDLVAQGPKDLATMLQYRTHADENSLYNTPPTFGIYVLGLMLKWLKSQGGLEAMARRNEEKAGKLYAYLDQSRLFRATAEPGSRSLMNVTFVTGQPAVDDAFLKRATREGLDGLKGHRSVGGMRASLYNAFPSAGVDALIALLRDFEQTHAPQS